MLQSRACLGGCRWIGAPARHFGADYTDAQRPFSRFSIFGSTMVLKGPRSILLSNGLEGLRHLVHVHPHLPCVGAISSPCHFEPHHSLSAKQSDRASAPQPHPLLLFNRLLDSIKRCSTISMLQCILGAGSWQGQGRLDPCAPPEPIGYGEEQLEYGEPKGLHWGQGSKVEMIVALQ